MTNVNLDNFTTFPKTFVLGAKSYRVSTTLRKRKKSPKHILTYNFVGNLIIYSKEHKQIRRISHPFKCPVTFWRSWIFWRSKNYKN